MKQLTIIIILLCSISLHSQDFSDVDAKVLEYPRFSKAEDLANKIEKDFSSDAHKARATFFWLAKNIRYNLKEYYNPEPRRFRIEFSSEEEKNRKLKAIKYTLVADMFRNKTGVCEEYAQAFKIICNLLNIESEVIKGYTRNNADEIGKTSKTVNHAWNAVKIDGSWVLLDATWAAGYNSGTGWIREFNPYFFDIPKSKIFKSHYPEKPVWVLRFGRMTLDAFYKQPVYTSTFLGLQTDLVSPTSGTIRVNSSKNIELEFKNFDTNSFVVYSFKGSKNSRKPIIKTVGDISTMTIKNPQRNTDLILFINNDDALYFKVLVR
ncbi:transglutaminase [Polaribacter sp. IC066]|uniref:transglutaminase domain-containing protein n=2 Tax=unclassified Polaribacter TaxID=196858 RepID=UPI0011BEF211|nr:transglutaminase domain-containing protein [Polaribacter sp. IC066]TXD54474.1 transglutaminase [Polaribacter sp. IC063]TXD62901.1 transglutaminase [Polaribacter sp. IC066]